jgi:glycogen synthase
MKNIIQITPTYPPNIGGVGHYAELLANHLIKKGVKSKFFVTDFSDFNKNNKIELFGKRTSKLDRKSVV